MHAPRRVQLCAILAAVDEGEFAGLRDALGVSAERAAATGGPRTTAADLTFPDGQSLATHLSAGVFAGAGAVRNFVAPVWFAR